MNKENNKLMLSFEITEDLKEKLRMEAFNKKKTLSATLRDIINTYFEEVKNAKSKN